MNNATIRIINGANALQKADSIINENNSSVSSEIFCEAMEILKNDNSINVIDALYEAESRIADLSTGIPVD